MLVPSTTLSFQGPSTPVDWSQSDSTWTNTSDQNCHGSLGADTTGRCESFANQATGQRDTDHGKRPDIALDHTNINEQRHREDFRLDPSGLEAWAYHTPHAFSVDNFQQRSLRLQIMDNAVLHRSTTSSSSGLITPGTTSYAGSFTTDFEQPNQEGLVGADSHHTGPTPANQARSHHAQGTPRLVSEGSAAQKNNNERKKREQIAEVIRRFEDVHQCLGSIDKLGSPQTAGNAKSSLLEFDKLAVLRLTAEILEAYYDEKLEQALTKGSQAVSKYRKRNQDRASPTPEVDRDSKRMRFMLDQHLTPCRVDVERKTRRGGQDAGNELPGDQHKCLAHGREIKYGSECRKEELKDCVEGNIKNFLQQMRDRAGSAGVVASEDDATILEAMFPSRYGHT